MVVPPVERTPLLGANGIDDETGREFLPRIRSELKPEASEEDVEKAKKEALMILAGMPQVHLGYCGKSCPDFMFLYQNQPHDQMSYRFDDME